MSDIFDAEGNRLLTALEVAEIAGIQRESFLTRVARGTAPQPVAHVGRAGLFREDEIRAWARWGTPRAPGRT